jgi:hypothetical protein
MYYTPLASIQSVIHCHFILTDYLTIQYLSATTLRYKVVTDSTYCSFLILQHYIQCKYLNHTVFLLYDSYSGFSMTPRSRVILDKLTVPQLVKKYPTFYVTWTFITIFITTCHLSLSWARYIQTMTSHPISLRSILILPYFLCLDLPSGVFL